MNPMNVILLNIFAVSLFLSPCNVYTYTISKSLHIPQLIKNSTETTVSSITQQPRNNHIKKHPFTSWGKIPEFTTQKINVNIPLMEIKLKKETKIEIKLKETKKSTNLKNKISKKFDENENKKNKNPKEQKEEKIKILDKNNTTEKIKMNISQIKNSTKEKEKIIQNATKQIYQISDSIQTIQKNTIEAIDETDENDEDQEESQLEIKQSINPIFGEISYIDDFQDFLKTQIEKINEEKEDYDSFSFDQHFIHNHYKVEKCNFDSCPINKGFCSNLQKNKCICNPHTLNFFPSTDPYNKKINRKFKKDLCGYEQKKIIFAMLLEIIIPFGMGHLYAERYLFALLKFVSFFMIPLMILLIFGIDIIENIKKKFKEI